MKNQRKEGLSRRDFLKGTAAGAAGIAAMSLMGAYSVSASEMETTSDYDGTPESTGRVEGYCGPGDWLGEAPVINESDITETIEVDVVVIGSGHSGLLASLGAIDEGASLAVIETQPWTAFVDQENSGTNAGGWYGEDIGHVNSQWLIDKGYGPYNTGEIAYEFIKRTVGRANPDIIKSFVQNSGAMFDRMVEVYEAAAERRAEEDSAVYIPEDLYGNTDVTVDFSNILEYPLCLTHCQKNGADYEGGYPIVAGDYKTWPCNAQFYGYQGNNIEYFNKYVVYYCQDQGAQYFFEHTAKVLTQNDNGDVTGVIVEDINNEGTYKKFAANKGVVLAAGDFIGNPDMCWALLNEGMEWAERGGTLKDDWTSTTIRNGQGHKMGCWAGGIIETTPRGWMSMGGGVDGPWGSTPLLQLNSKGKRYYNEASMCTKLSISWQQIPGAACYVTDSKLVEFIEEGPLDHGATNFAWQDQYDMFIKTFNEIEVGNPEGSGVSGCNLAGMTRLTTVYAAETLDELADFLGYEGDVKETFLAEIEHYNELCNSEDGDTDYGKDKKYMKPIDEPPYYGGTGSLSNTPRPGMVTLSGLVTDEYQRVSLGGDVSTPIKGLYACGNCLGRRYGQGYTTPFAGNSVGMAMTHGWLAGQYAAQAI